MWLSEGNGGCKSSISGGRWGAWGGGRKLGRGVNRFFSVFGTWFFGKDRGCKSDERGGGCGSGVTVVEVAGGVGMSVGGAGASKRGNAVVIGGWDVGVGGGGAR